MKNNSVKIKKIINLEDKLEAIRRYFERIDGITLYKYYKDEFPKLKPNNSKSMIIFSDIEDILIKIIIRKIKNNNGNSI